MSLGGKARGPDRWPYRQCLRRGRRAHPRAIRAPTITWPTGRAQARRAPMIKPTAPAASCGTIWAAGCRTRRLLSRWGHDLDAQSPPRWLTGGADEHGTGSPTALHQGSGGKGVQAPLGGAGSEGDRRAATSLTPGRVMLSARLLSDPLVPSPSDFDRLSQAGSAA